MEKWSRIIRGLDDRAEARAVVVAAPVGAIVTVRKATRTDEQSAKFHAMCGELSKAVTYHGSMWTLDQWKQMLITSLWGLEMIPSLKGDGGYIPMRRSSKALTVREMSDLIEFTNVVAAERGHVFTDPRAARRQGR
jgi:hypothetical protein